MGRFRKHLYEGFEDENHNPNLKYALAYKQVKRIKGFYMHALVYVLVNAFVIGGYYFVGNSSDNIYLVWKPFPTVFFWGIGLLAHGLSVFGRNLLFTPDWEEKKIKEILDKDNNQKWE